MDTLHCKEIKLKSGQKRWVCIADGPRLPNGKRNQVERRGKTQREAKKKVLDEIERLNDTGVNSKLSKLMTFEKIAEKWLVVYAATGVKRGSVRVREKEVKLLNKYFADVPIANIDHYMYQKALFDLNEKEYAHNTISGVNTCANMIFKYAKRNKLITDNPRDEVVIPKKSITVEELESDSIEETYFEADELNEFFSAVLTEGLELDVEWFYTLAFSGMRPGELCALKKSDLSFKYNEIRISKTLYSEKNNMREYLIDTTKTNKMRIIEVDITIMNMLKKLVRKNDIHKMKHRLSIEDFHDADFVFQRSNGYPYFTKNIASRMQRILKFTSIKKNLTPHAFRHTHISMLAESGAELPTIMNRVGHVDPNTTLKVYTHVTDKMKMKSVDNLSSFNQDILLKLADLK